MGAQRLKQHRDEACGQQGDHEVTPRLQNGAQSAYHQRVEAEDTDGESTIDQRAVDNDIDIP
ncbi:hypothetical protein KSB_43520 [Ktedonobacter robiniae]|uniref:Uncharacterized protein n=1 Tax=Ktedonobacter robiniae TaxID=2778365 RepID=A0ABQ3UTH3_9CHLR|nr:hypothetical protein KSB_43520 [Ktedonobacter robiniae]